MRERRDRVRERCAEAGLDAFLATSLPDVRYLSGFTGSSGALFVGAEPPDVFFTDGRYRLQIENELAPDLEAVIAQGPPWKAAVQAARERGMARLGFGRAHLTVADWEMWREAAPPEPVGVDGWVEELRAIKSAAEIDALRRAAGIADRAFGAVLAFVRPGIEERSLARELERLLLEEGAERPSFETIAAFGERSALPHARPTGRRLARGEVALLDFGAVVDGYHSDMTRTVSCGSPPAGLDAVYGVVLAAQQAAIGGLRAGLSGREADALARDVIEAAGFGERFAHSLGHGIGLEVHERPRLSRTSDDVLEADMVVTVEPGIYISGIGGVRVEDDVVIRPDGALVLTSAPRDTWITL